MMCYAKMKLLACEYPQLKSDKIMHGYSFYFLEVV